jgi:hypothetical protein
MANDNMTALPGWLSNGLCRLAVGSGITIRSLGSRGLGGLAFLGCDLRLIQQNPRLCFRFVESTRSVQKVLLSRSLA